MRLNVCLLSSGPSNVNCECCILVGMFLGFLLRQSITQMSRPAVTHSAILLEHVLAFRTAALEAERSCRCQASDSNGKPGLLFGLKNPFRGLRFGLQGNDNETNQAEQEESQQQQAADKAQPVGHSMPWRAWAEVSTCMHYLLHTLCNRQNGVCRSVLGPRLVMQ